MDKRYAQEGDLIRVETLGSEPDMTEDVIVTGRYYEGGEADIGVTFIDSHGMEGAVIDGCYEVLKFNSPEPVEKKFVSYGNFGCWLDEDEE